MPRELPRIAMAVEEYLAMPHRLGFKQEYLDGEMWLSLNHSAVYDYSLSVADFLFKDVRGAGSAFQIIPIATLAPLRDGLLSLFRAAFEDSVLYAGYDADAFHESAHRSIEDYERTRSCTDNCDPFSSVAAIGGEMIGAALIASDHDGRPLLQPIMVAPHHRRRGVATALLRRSAASLAEVGHCVLKSCCHMANAQSVAWHKSVGFEPRLSWLAAAHLAHHHRINAKHHRLRGELEAAGRHRRLADRYTSSADRLRNQALAQ